MESATGRQVGSVICCNGLSQSLWHSSAPFFKNITQKINWAIRGKNRMIYHVHPHTIEDSQSSCWGFPGFVLTGAQEEHIGYWWLLWRWGAMHAWCYKYGSNITQFAILWTLYQSLPVKPHLDRLARDAGPALRVPGALTTAYGDAAGTSASPSPNASAAREWSILKSMTLRGHPCMKYLKFSSPNIQLQIPVSTFLVKIYKLLLWTRGIHLESTHH